MKRDRVRNSSLESWQIDAEKLDEGVTAYGGLPMVIETWYGLKLHKACERHVKLRERQKGLSDAEWAEVTTMLLMAGGRSVEDVESLKADTGLSRLWSIIDQASPRSLLNYLHRFHDPQEPAARQGKARIGRESKGLKGLGKVNTELIGHIQRQAPEEVVTIDIDASVHESHKKEALWTYDGVRGYQPVIAYWAEQGVILADQFREGNVPAGMGNLGVVRQALAALPDGVKERYVRGDSALYEQKLLRELDGEGIGFGISADVSKELREAMRALPEAEWKPYVKTRSAQPDQPTDKQWAEVPFVPEEKSPKKDARPFRYVGIRIPRQEADLFEGPYMYFAVVTNRWEMDGNALLNWQRQRCGTVEWAHDVLKNDFAARVLPSGRFGANAAWYRFNVLAFNLKVAMTKIGLPDFVRARPHTFRMRLLQVAGRVISHSRRLSMRMGAHGQAPRDLLCGYERDLALALG
jgi:hypothetical protein